MDTVTCNGGQGWRTPAPAGECVNIEHDCANTGYVPSRCGSPTTAHPDSPKRRTASQEQSLRADTPETTRTSSIRFWLGLTSEASGGLDRLGRDGPPGQTAASRDRPRRPLRHGLRHYLPVHDRSDRSPSLPAQHRAFADERVARPFASDGRQAHDRSSSPPWRPAGHARRRRHRPPQASDGDLPGHRGQRVEPHGAAPDSAARRDAVSMTCRWVPQCRGSQLLEMRARSAALWAGGTSHEVEPS